MHDRRPRHGARRHDALGNQNPRSAREPRFPRHSTTRVAGGMFELLGRRKMTSSERGARIARESAADANQRALALLASPVAGTSETLGANYLGSGLTPSGAKGLGVLHHLPIFRPFFHFHKNLSSSVISVAFSRENCFPQKPKKRPKIAKHTKHEPLPKRDAIFAIFP